jgi:hypothetical protein
MAQLAIHNPNASRMRLLVWPREHGAWGILGIPLVTGAVVGLGHGTGVGSFFLFAVAALSVFCLRTPVESLLGTTPMRAQTAAERRTVAFALAIFAALALLALGGLLWTGANRGLYALGAIAGLLFALQSLMRRLGRQARMLAQLVGALGLTSTAAGAYYVITRQLDMTALSLWFANWVFAGNQVHFVQLRIRGARLACWAEKFAQGRSFFVGQILMMLGLASLWRLGLLPGLAIVAFVPVFIRGMRWFFTGPQPLRVHRLGVTELVHALAFGGLLIAGFCW